MTAIRKLAFTLALILALGLAGCSEESSQQQGGQDSGGESSGTSVEMNDEETTGEAPEKEPAKGDGMEETTSGFEETTAASSGGSGEVSVGGFAVEGFDAPAVEVPEVQASPEDVMAYREQIEPIVSGSIRDVSEVVEPKARMENGNLELGVDVEPIEEARTAAQQGLEELQQVQPPESLAPVQQSLVESYERAIPAYENLIEAFQGGDVDQLNTAVTESLPEIEQAAAVQRDILQDLEQAAN